MTGLPDHHFVECDERLAVVGAHLHHCALADGCRAGVGGLGEGRPGCWRVGHEDAGVPARERVDPDDGLRVEVLRRVGDEPVLPDDEDHVAGLEHEAGQIAPLDRCPPPVGRDTRRDVGERRADALVAFLDAREALPALIEEEGDLAARPVAGEQFGQLARAVHDNGPRGRCPAGPGHLTGLRPRLRPALRVDRRGRSERRV